MTPALHSRLADPPRPRPGRRRRRPPCLSLPSLPAPLLLLLLLPLPASGLAVPSPPLVARCPPPLLPPIAAWHVPDLSLAPVGDGCDDGRFDDGGAVGVWEGSCDARSERGEGERVGDGGDAGIDDSSPSEELITLHNGKTVTASAILQAKRGRVRHSSPLPPSRATVSDAQIRALYDVATSLDKQHKPRAALSVLRRLRRLRPSDTRVLRRMARLTSNSLGSPSAAARILRAGLRSHPHDPYLWHGLAVHETQHGAGDDASVSLARRYFRRAIACRPDLPHPYHAWGLWESRRGRPEMGLAILRRGLEQVPGREGHRLCHACGTVEARLGMWARAERSYRRGIAGVPAWHRARSFLCTGLGAVYAKSRRRERARKYFREGLRDNQRHAQGWAAWALAEEREFKDVEAARKVYAEAVGRYEASCRNGRGLRASARNSGNKWVTVYRHWANLEKKEGDFKAASDIYARGVEAFDNDWKLWVDWAKTLYDDGEAIDLVELTFEEALTRAGTSTADPYRTYAEYQMDLGRPHRARAIFQHGAATVSDSDDGRPRGLAPLFHSWAVCEWSAGGPPDRAARLFDLALQHAPARSSPDAAGPPVRAGEGDARLVRSWILLSRARFELFGRENARLAGHYASMAVVEHGGGGTPEAWTLWGDVACRLRDPGHARTCFERAIELRSRGRGKKGEDRLAVLRQLPAWDAGMLVRVSRLLHSLEEEGGRGDAAEGRQRHLHQNAPWQKEEEVEEIFELVM